MRKLCSPLGCLLFLLAMSLPESVAARECVVLLHGLARTASSLETLAGALAEAGYLVQNIDSPSREHPIEELSPMIMPGAVAACRAQQAESINFVTHSMGGIIVRYYLLHNQLDGLGKVVMLSPPNGGSEVVDELGDNYFFKLLNGPAGQQLGTGPDSLPNRLGGARYPVGVITGDSTFNPILSLLIPGDDDGKVSVERAKLANMHDFLVLPSSHPFIMDDETAIAQTIAVLRQGCFVR